MWRTGKRTLLTPMDFTRNSGPRAWDVRRWLPDAKMRPQIRATNVKIGYRLDTFLLHYMYMILMHIMAYKKYSIYIYTHLYTQCIHICSHICICRIYIHGFGFEAFLPQSAPTWWKGWSSNQAGRIR